MSEETIYAFCTVILNCSKLFVYACMYVTVGVNVELDIVLNIDGHYYHASCDNGCLKVACIADKYTK